MTGRSTVRLALCLSGMVALSCTGLPLPQPSPTPSVQPTLPSQTAAPTPTDGPAEPTPPHRPTTRPTTPEPIQLEVFCARVLVHESRFGDYPRSLVWDIHLWPGEDADLVASAELVVVGANDGLPARDDAVTEGNPWIEMGFDSHGVKRVSAFVVELRTGKTRDLTEALMATGLERDDVRTGPGNGILIGGYRQVYTSCPG